MRVDFYGMAFETPRVTVYLWSPWRSSMLEHKLFESVMHHARGKVEKMPDEVRLHIDDSKQWRNALHGVARVLKGWQEEAEQGTERRTWRWLLEADTDADGYDHGGEPASIWGFLRLALDRNAPDEPQKGEDIDLDGFGVQIWPVKE